jgi:RNA polymerase sigma-70 factor (ECF subfamily)
VTRRSRNEFEELMLPHLDAAYGLARWLMRDPTEAEDVVQDAYLKAFAAFAQYRGGSSAAWLLTIVRNSAITTLRRQKARANVVVLRDLMSSDDPEIEAALGDENSGPETKLITKAEQGAVHRALDSLSEIFREVIVLRELEGLSYKEIATITQLPIGTVMSRLARGRIALREALQENGEGDERNRL